MTALSIQPPYPTITDTDGQPLEDGYIWIGVANLPPIGNPIAVYWDAALTQPAALPVRTRGGYPVNAGTPARLYVNSDYSIQVQNRNGSVVYSAPAATERYGNGVITSVSASDVTFLQSGAGAVTRTVQNKLQDYVNVFDFMTPAEITAVQNATPGTDVTAAVQAAIDASPNVYFPPGTYPCNVTINAFFNWQGAGSQKSVLKPVSTSVPVVMFMYEDFSWEYCSVNDIGFESTAQQGTAFSYGNPSAYTVGQENIGRVVFNRCSFYNFNIGILKNYGNIGNEYNYCTYGNNNYGHFAQSNNIPNPAAPIMHCGNDMWNGGHFQGNFIACVAILNNQSGGGQWLFNGVVFEINAGFAVFCDRGTLSNFYMPLVINNCWDEGNATAGTVTIQTISGPQVLVPEAFYINGADAGFNSFQIWAKSAELNGIGTFNPQAALGIWKNQGNALNLIAGGFGVGADFTRIGFSSRQTESTLGASIAAILESGTIRTLQLRSGSFDALAACGNGSVKIGNDAVASATPGDGSHLLYGNDNTAAARILSIGATAASDTRFYVADDDLSNAANTVVRVGKNVGTSRSINAGGTVNASGTDYAEYMVKAGDFTINKGDICGIDASGKLTNVFSQAVSFVVKSTNPSYVGGDTWGSDSVVGQRPEKPARVFDKWDEDNQTLIERGDSDEEYASKLRSYEAAMAEWTPKYEAARQTVDRIAFSGQVPVNVTGAEAGQFIVPVQAAGDTIGGIAVRNPTFEQYQLAVGKVIAIEDDGRARIIVKIA
jgi:hypothetical protein